MHHWVHEWVVALSILLPVAGGCDWVLEPWKGFKAVTSAVEGAPTGWELDG